MTNPSPRTDTLQRAVPAAGPGWLGQATKAIRGTTREASRRAWSVRFRWGGARHIHVVREDQRTVNWAFFKWLKLMHPRLARLFRHTTAEDAHAGIWDGAALLIPWVQDPVRERSPALFDRLRELELQYERAGLPVANPVGLLSNAIKSHALESMRNAGLRTARVLHIDAATAFDEIAAIIGIPFIVRNDQGHGGLVCLIREPADLRAVPWDRLPHPIALEFIDTRCEDGLYRKYRYLLTGNVGITRHLVITPSWCAHAEDRVRGAQFINEEMAFLETDNPYHEPLDAARRALGMDYVAFDYSVDRDGHLVVWEPNPFPVLWARSNARDAYYEYQRDHLGKVFSHVLRFYLDKAKLSQSL